MQVEDPQQIIGGVADHGVASVAAGHAGQRGVTVVYISHFLEEVRQVADRFTVLRDGRSVGGGGVGDFSTERIIELMVGRSLAE